jgi:transcriptional regulator with XRE-family HTH domain
MLAYRERYVMTADEQQFSALATTLRTLREGAGLSQRALSEVTGVAEPLIFRLEQDKKIHPTLQDIMPIANYFGLTPNDIAALLGLWNEPSNLSQTPKLSAMLSNLNQLIDIADPALQDEIADDLDVVLGLLIRRHSDKLKDTYRPTLTKDAISKLPAFLRRRFTQ